MLARTRSRAKRSALTALAVALVVSGCGGDDPGDDPGVGRAEQSPSVSRGSPAQSDSPSQPASPSPADSPATDDDQQSPSAAGDAPSSAAAPLKGNARLLSAGQLPGFNQTFGWRVEATRSQEGRRSIGTCHRFSLTAIGATGVAVRRFTPAGPADGASAAQLLADFADQKSAKRAYQVLESWAAECEDWLQRYPRVQIGDPQPVRVGPSGPAGWYLLVYGPAPGDRDAGYFDAQGLTRVGSTVSVLQMRLVGQDYNYLPGREPMVRAVRRAAQKLGGG